MTLLTSSCPLPTPLFCETSKEIEGLWIRPVYGSTSCCIYYRSHSKIEITPIPIKKKALLKQVLRRAQKKRRTRPCWSGRIVGREIEVKPLLRLGSSCKISVVGVNVVSPVMSEHRCYNALVHRQKMLTFPRPLQFSRNSNDPLF